MRQHVPLVRLEIVWIVGVRRRVQCRLDEGLLEAGIEIPDPVTSIPARVSAHTMGCGKDQPWMDQHTTTVGPGVPVLRQRNHSGVRVPRIPYAGWQDRKYLVAPGLWSGRWPLVSTTCAHDQHQHRPCPLRRPNSMGRHAILVNSTSGHHPHWVDLSLTSVFQLLAIRGAYGRLCIQAWVPYPCLISRRETSPSSRGASTAHHCPC